MADLQEEDAGQLRVRKQECTHACYPGCLTEEVAGTAGSVDRHTGHLTQGCSFECHNWPQESLHQWAKETGRVPPAPDSSVRSL